MSKRTRTALILSDWQVDLHDEGFINKTLQLAKDLQPDKIIHVGDESDTTAIGRWVQGTPAAAENNLQTQIDITHSLLRKFREACPDATFDICYSNHLARFSQSITTRLPAFRHLRALSIESLFGLDSLEITYRREIFEVFPDVIAGHGHQWGLTSANQYAKGTQVVAKTGKSVVAGHTHRPLLTTAATGYNFNMATNFYMNVGCAMEFSAAEYITSKSPEWAHGVGVLTWNRTLDRTQPELIVGQSGRFYYQNRMY
jgi:predicted phosphodiesterase